ncbi:hypothetical protein STENM223S_01702 [Streptomyces tendae]
MRVVGGLEGAGLLLPRVAHGGAGVAGAGRVGGGDTGRGAGVGRADGRGGRSGGAGHAQGCGAFGVVGVLGGPAGRGRGRLAEGVEAVAAGGGRGTVGAPGAAGRTWLTPPTPHPSHPPHPAEPGPYRRLFAVPGARAFTAGNLLAGLPMGMFGVSAIVMIAGSRGSYALAGAVTATGLAATAVVAPWTARLVDRHGQARVALPATLFAVLGSLALVLCVRYDAPDWTLFAAYAATATTPNTGGMSRARWAHLLKGRPDALHTANSFEQAADELCFMLGPVLAAVLCGAFFPEAGTLTGAVLLLTGVALFTAPALHGAAGRAPRRRAGPALRAPGVRPLLAGVSGDGRGVRLAGGGAVRVRPRARFGGRRGARRSRPAGSCVAGLLYGAVRPTGPARSRLAWRRRG